MHMHTHRHRRRHKMMRSNLREREEVRLPGRLPPGSPAPLPASPHTHFCLNTSPSTIQKAGNEREREGLTREKRTPRAPNPRMDG